jgi:hypothetical protein
MFLVLRNLNNGLFYSKDRWTVFPNRAQKFRDREEAESVVKAASLSQVEIAILIDWEIVGGMPVEATDSVGDEMLTKLQ